MNDLVTREIDTEALALEVARNQVGMKLPIQQLLAQLHVDPDYFIQLSKDEVFLKQVKTFTKELKENGVSFQLKARIQAEAMLKKNWQLVHDDETPAAVAVKAIENTVRWAGLEQKTNTAVQQTNAPGFQIIFNIPTITAPTAPTTTPHTIDITPTQPQAAE
jgi:hypothetical protein